MPTRERNVSAIGVKLGPSWILLDCGEGTQYRVLIAPLRPHGLEAVLITHLHGDHVFGLPGLLGTMSLQRRVAPLTVYGPRGIRDFLSASLALTSVRLTFEMNVQEVEPGWVRRTATYSVLALPLDHRVPAFGYRLEAPGWRIAYCTDTRPCAAAVELGRRADLLIHEATYTRDLQLKADERGHSTAAEAARIASQAGARRLLLTHFSPRYDDLDPLLSEARAIFRNADVARDLVAVALDAGDAEKPALRAAG